MAQPDLKRAKVVEGYSHQVEGDEYTTYHRAYHMGRRTLAEENLEPRDSLPEDATISIVHSRMGKIKGEASEVAIVVARKAKYKTGTVSGTGTITAKAMTLNSGGPFYPQIVGQEMTIAGGDPATDIVAAYVSPTSVTMTTSQAAPIGPVAITFPFADTELARSRYYRGSKKSYWSAVKRFHATPADVEALVDDLWDSYFLFNSNFPRAYSHAITVVDEDPMILTKSLITVEYRTAYNPKQYPIGKATQEMYTTGDTIRRQKDLTTPTALDIETKPGINGYYHAVETGSNVVPDPKVIFVVRTAILRGSLNYATIASYAGKGNSLALSYIGGGIPQYCALCLKVAVAEDYIDDGSDAYVPMQYWFAVYKGLLTEICTARQRRRWLKGEFVLHPDDDPDHSDRYYLNKDGSKSAANTTTNAKIRIMMHDCWANDDDGESEDAADRARVVIAFQDFSAIDGLLEW